MLSLTVNKILRSEGTVSKAPKICLSKGLLFILREFLCLVLVEPKAPCYRAHVCVLNSVFLVFFRQQPETTFEQCSFDFRIPRRHDVDGNFLLRSLHVLTLRVCSATLVSFLCLRRGYLKDNNAAAHSVDTGISIGSET